MAVLARGRSEGDFPFEKTRFGVIFAVTKSSKVSPRPFPNWAHVDTYALATPPALPSIALGLPSQEVSKRKRRLDGVDSSRFGFGFPAKAFARFIAGWSSPVARQAHNLKVVSSNLTPATKLDAVMTAN